MDCNFVCGGGGGFAGLILDEPHRQMRLMSFMHPFESAGGYNQKHALIAFTLGGLFGGGAGAEHRKMGLSAGGAQRLYHRHYRRGKRAGRSDADRRAFVFYHRPRRLQSAAPPNRAEKFLARFTPSASRRF